MLHIFVPRQEAEDRGRDRLSQMVASDQVRVDDGELAKVAAVFGW